MINDVELKTFLDEKVVAYNTFDFIENDPVCIPHRYHLKEDIEIAGFLAATTRQLIDQGAKPWMSQGETPWVNAPSS